MWFTFHPITYVIFHPYMKSPFQCYLLILFFLCCQSIPITKTILPTPSSFVTILSLQNKCKFTACIFIACLFIACLYVCICDHSTEDSHFPILYLLCTGLATLFVHPSVISFAWLFKIPGLLPHSRVYCSHDDVTIFQWPPKGDTQIGTLV